MDWICGLSFTVHETFDSIIYGLVMFILSVVAVSGRSGNVFEIEIYLDDCKGSHWRVSMFTLLCART